MELKKEKFVNDVYMTKEDLSGRTIDISGIDKEYFQDIARHMAKTIPGWLTPERKKSFGLE
ncbi:MAG: hypothetical protein ACRC5H_06425 [Treponemataceae bacterium]